MFRTIVIDPPWPEHGGTWGAQNYYKTMKPHEILRTILNCELFKPDPSGCHGYLWATNWHLKAALWLLEALDFRYITTITWAKNTFGLGQYFRGQTEHLLFGMIGKLPALCKTESTLCPAPKRGHSVKPFEIYERIERVSPPPRLEMFARKYRPGWQVWGDEVKAAHAQTA